MKHRSYPILAIEPMNCTANWHDNDKLEIWTSTQVPGELVSTIAKHYGIPEDNLTLNVTIYWRRLWTKAHL